MGYLIKKNFQISFFNDKEKLKTLNSFIHPLVNEEFNKWCKSQDSKYVIKEAAIIFEEKTNLNLDKVICVISDKKTKIFIVERGYTSFKIKKILNCKVF